MTYHSLHGLRALAAISVLLFHWGSAIGFFSQAQKLTTISLGGVSFSVLAPLDFGWLGVPVFFILSAVLLAPPWLSAELTATSYFTYLRRRFLRIFPAYWLQLLALALFAMPLAIAFHPQDHWGLLRHALLLINLPPWMDKPLNPVWWTLPVEFGFYLILPVLLLLFKGRPIVLLLFALTLTVLWRAGVMANYETANYAQHIYVLDALPGVLFTFCLGLAIVMADQQKLAVFFTDKLKGFILPLLGFVSLLILLKVNLAGYWQGGVLLLLWPAAIALCLAMLVARFRFAESRILSARPLQYLGDISFGIYLWHYPVLQFLAAKFAGQEVGLFIVLSSLLLCVILTIILSHISYIALEKPCMKLFRKQ